MTIDAPASRAAAPSIWQTYARSRYTVLFYALLSMLVAMPVVNFFGLPSWTMKGVVAVCLVLAVLPNATKRNQAIFLATIFLLIVARFLSERDDVPIDFGPILALYALTGLLAAAATFRFVVRSTVVDHETVYAALSTYLLAGLFFGVLYSAIEYMWPGSFTGPDDFTEASAVYYSVASVTKL